MKYKKIIIIFSVHFTLDRNFPLKNCITVFSFLTEKEKLIKISL